MARTLVALPRPAEPDDHTPETPAQPLAASRRTRIAVLGAALSLLMIALMVTGAVLCAGRSCRHLVDPAPARAVLDLDRGQPHPQPDLVGRGPTAPIAPGPTPAVSAR
jgi:hypothetical protein